jgi:integrase
MSDAQPAKGGGRNLPTGVFPHHGKWWVVYYVTGSDGRRIRQRERTDAASPREAAKIRAARMTEHARGERTIESGKVTVGDATQAVLDEYERKGRRSMRTAKGYAKAINATFGAHTLAVNVSDKVDAAQIAWQRAGLTNATINRRCNLLRHGLRLLVRRRLLAFVPFIERLEEHSAPGRYIAPSTAEAIRTNLPPTVAPVFTLALLLGIRKGQLTRTLRRFVDLERDVIAWPPSECKAKAAHVVPLDPDALKIVADAMAEGRTRTWCPYLFHGADCAPGRKPSKGYGCIGEFKKPWAAALNAANLTSGQKAGGYTFHHTRNTAATDMRAGGLGEDETMAVGGWKTREVFGRYNLGDVEQLRERLTASRARRGKVVPMRKAGG